MHTASDKTFDRRSPSQQKPAEHNTIGANPIAYHVLRGAVLVRVPQDHEPGLVQSNDMAPGQPQVKVLKEGVAREPKQEESQKEERFGASGQRVHKLGGAQEEDTRVQKLQQMMVVNRCAR